MTSRPPPTPPMSETNTISVASSVLELSDLAAKVSVRLLTLSRKTKDAIKPIEALSKDIAATGAVLHQLGRQLKKDEGVRVGSSNLATTVDDLVDECSKVFESIDKALDGNTSGCKAILGLQHYVQFASLKPEIALLETNLERLKTPLTLMLNVLIYAEQLKSRRSQADKSLLKDQQDLIRMLNDERKVNERRYHKLEAESKATSETPLPSIPASIAPWEDLSPIPEMRKREPTNNEATEKGAKPRNSSDRGRIWIKSESPEPEEQPIKNGSITSRDTSTTDQRSIKTRNRLRNLFRNRDALGDDSKDASLLDMASFLRSSASDSPDQGTQVFVYNEPVNVHRPHSRLEPRGQTVRADGADLISFFRDGSPRVRRNGIARTQNSTSSVHQLNPPKTPPLTGREDREKSTNLPMQGSPPKAHIRSQSTGVPSPLASHPPRPQLDTTRPAISKWPLQSVTAWLEQNGFSPEWQQAFRVLQIEGSEFVELESGSSIRKMLTVIYPQVAREYAASGRASDKTHERAEGQRLRKLIRELPVDAKYVERQSTERQVDEMTVTPLPARRQRAPAPPPKAVASENILTENISTENTSTENTSTENISTTPSTQPLSRHPSNLPSFSPLSEQDEQITVMQAISSPPVKPLNYNRHERSVSEMSNVSDEWVKRWTILSPEEIARGRETIST